MNTIDNVTSLLYMKQMAFKLYTTTAAYLRLFGGVNT